MNPPLNQADKLLGTATLLLLGLAGYWLGQPQPPFRAPAPAAQPASAAPVPPSSPTREQDQAVDPALSAAMAADEAELRRNWQKIPADTSVHFVTYDPEEGDSLAHPHTYRRYVGTLNGQAIVVHLSIYANLRVEPYREYWSGSWYYRYARHSTEHPLLFRRLHGGRLVLRERIPDDAPAADTASIEWQFSWPLGRRLQGRRRAVHGLLRQQVQLREDYSQATRYELARLTAHGYYCPDEPGRSQPYYSTEFLHLLRADSLRLARWQAPPPAARRDTLRRWLLQDPCQELSQSTWVTLNDYGLLSYNVWTSSFYFGGNHPTNSQHGVIVDLTTGRKVRMAALLRPGAEPALRKLLARHLRHDYPDLEEKHEWHWETVPPLPDSFLLTPTGLHALYDDYALTAYALHYANNTTIPYAELRPLVRPGTALDRMLKARGI
ncbi:DUF3298 domain-containing protein [Hymenobacter gummosus]|uniref:DUF3298 domain-containing protein n=1 Tax=Hymenobacter gummosus TaxID=1776032 RepID=A0A431U6K8_9BACT|nr:RsiV family protein [Hymenobacter gummosus]RTQ52276.1 DUF3298 domain-containing protein [Hymenobacter gummosus]